MSKSAVKKSCPKATSKSDVQKWRPKGTPKRYIQNFILVPILRTSLSSIAPIKCRRSLLYIFNVLYYFIVVLGFEERLPSGIPGTWHFATLVRGIHMLSWIEFQNHSNNWDTLTNWNYLVVGNILMFIQFNIWEYFQLHIMCQLNAKYPPHVNSTTRPNSPICNPSL